MLVTAIYATSQLVCYVTACMLRHGCAPYVTVMYATSQLVPYLYRIAQREPFRYRLGKPITVVVKYLPRRTNTHTKKKRSYSTSSEFVAFQTLPQPNAILPELGLTLRSGFLLHTVLNEVFESSLALRLWTTQLWRNLTRYPKRKEINTEFRIGAPLCSSSSRLPEGGATWPR